MTDPQSNSNNASGCLVLIVGPSGVGKDTLMQAARKVLVGEPNIVFPHRLITRASDPKYEDHASLSMEEFEALCESGEVPLHWRAHGHGYAVPQSVLNAVREGQCCVVNGSRGVLDQARDAFPRACAILIDLDRRNLEARIANRGREGAEEAQQRLNRQQPDLSAVPGVHRLVNDRTVEAGAQTLASLIRDCAKGALPCL